MSLFVNTNVSSINARRQLFNLNNNLNVKFERLLSGFRINGATDDAACLQISKRLTTQLLGLDMAVRNANDAISLTQTVQGVSHSMGLVSQEISIIDAKRVDLDALQNRFQSTIKNLSNISENVSAAISRVGETYFAAETADSTRWQIIHRASLTALGKSNQRPQAALHLLQS